MTEVWLHPNRRVLLLAMVPAVLLGGLGGFMLSLDAPMALKAVAWLVIAFAFLLTMGLVGQTIRPRISYREGHVCFHLKSGKPFAVPIHVVEAFFLGQGPSYIPGSDQSVTKTVNLVARLSQKETDWAQRDVKESLGNWDEGYITIRGTWCEPLTKEVIRDLNQKLSIAAKSCSATKENQEC